MVRSMAWKLRSICGSSQGPTRTGKRLLPRLLAIHASPLHQSDAVKCSLSRAITARQRRSW